MTKGLLEALIEPIPRMRTEVPEPGCPEPEEICTPATEPSKAFTTLLVCAPLMVSSLTVVIEPVNDFLSVAP